MRRRASTIELLRVNSAEGLDAAGRDESPDNASITLYLANWIRIDLGQEVNRVVRREHSRLICNHTTGRISTKQIEVVRFGRVPFGRVVREEKS
jgi:hypothetical protein